MRSNEIKKVSKVELSRFVTLINCYNHRGKFRFSICIFEPISSFFKAIIFFKVIPQLYFLMKGMTFWSLLINLKIPVTIY